MGRNKARIKNVGKIYWIGVALWLIMWLIILGLFKDTLVIVNPTSPIYSWFFLVPIVSCLFYLVWNAQKWRYPRCYEDYKTEVDIILFVERNASILALSISMVILFTGTGIVGITVPPAFIWYLFLALTFTICGVLPLYWIPSDRVEDLVRLRNAKTVPFFYAISFFLAGFVSVILTNISTP